MRLTKKKRWPLTGRALKDIRIHILNLSVEELAKKLKISRQFLNRVELGLGRPSAQVFQGIIKLRNRANPNIMDYPIIRDLGEDLFAQLCETTKKE
jgi:transcriptional regulator with XRE-family HTH domain